jgi:hypothetical protein
MMTELQADAKQQGKPLVHFWSECVGAGRACEFWLVFLVVLVVAETSGAEWQWSAPVAGGKEGAGPARAFLWIPPDCGKVRAVVLAQNNLEEIQILENPKFRRAMSDLGFAEIWVSPAFDHLFRFNEGAGETFERFMSDLAGQSGYEELKVAPIVGLGHSAAASWPYYFAAWNPQRTLAALSVSGQWPYFRDKIFAPDIWGDKNIDFIPSLETMGEYESADTWSNEGLKERREHPLMPLSMLANPAQGHFSSTDQKVEYLALYLRKAAQYRLPQDTPAGQPPKLKPVDPTRTGWLVDRWRLNQAPAAHAAPVGRYGGDPGQAFWFFDEEMANATGIYEAAHRGQKGQLLGYIQDGQVVPQSNSHEQIRLKFLPQEDGVTFKLGGAFLDTVPGESPRPAGWVAMPAGSQVGHASGGGPVTIDRICGPFVKLAPDTFAVRMERGLGANLKSYDLWFAANHPGDDQYKPAIQQALMHIPSQNTTGADQHIAFPEIQDRREGAGPVKLNATSDSGLKVYYYVLAGPAEVEDGTLKFTTVPPRSRFPMKVTVVAWQYGRASEPKVKSAGPVERTFSLVK